MSERVHSHEPQPATGATRDILRDARAVLCFDDPGDDERATRGLVATHPTGRITRGDHTVWDVGRYDFERSSPKAPDTVHPSLWRQARLNAHHGLFRVADGVWQARGYDLSNITFIAGKRGWIIIDPLTTSETAAACLALANQHLGRRPVTAVIYTHSHVDHYGGAEGVTTAQAVANGDVRILAPRGFLREAVSENVVAGPAMRRRAMYQFGMLLPPGPQGHVDCGLGKGVPVGSAGLIAPSEEIDGTGIERVVDGVRVAFQNTPGAEAPAEMNFFFPELRLLCMAENCTHNLHNLYPLRGTQVRDALAWSKYIGQALSMFGADSDNLFATHHWPRFGHDDVVRFLELQRDVYRWLHDQTMRLANRGLDGDEIAAQLTLPECFRGASHVQGYYGTVSHNVRSVYQRYLGWYDGNPANLDPLPRVETSRRYLEFMGGADAVLDRAQACFARGEYRWVAQVVNHVVFAAPDNLRARTLQADALEQLGYQAESATWRNAYLCGAQELRHGSLRVSTAGRLQFEAMEIEQIVDSLGVRFAPERLGEERIELNLHLRDLRQDHVLSFGNAAISYRVDARSDTAQVSLRTNRAALGRLFGFNRTLADEISQDELELTGDQSVLERVLAAFDRLDTGFALVEP